MDNLRKLMDSSIEKLGLSGIDCIIYQDHKEIFRHMSGYSEIETKTPMKADAIYNIYSASKMITCVAALQLFEQGKFLLEDPLSDYLPEFKQMRVKRGTFTVLPARNQIRIVDLFTMMAGLSYEADVPSVRALKAEKGLDFTTRDFVKALAKEPLLFEPGENWHYSFCHDVLAALVEEISGMSFGDYLKANIFDPLGMKDTGFSIPEKEMHRLAPQYSFDYWNNKVNRITSDSQGRMGKGHQSGGGGLVSTSEDYILFVDALACDGVGKTGARILSPAAIKLMSTNRLSGDALTSFRYMKHPGLGYGLGVAVYDDSAAAGTLVPEGSFYWGGMGGVQNLVDQKNRLSYFVAQHTIGSPKPKIMPHMWNVLYANLG